MDQYRIGDVSKILNKNKNDVDSKLSSLFTIKDTGKAVNFSVIQTAAKKLKQENQVKKNPQPLKQSRKIAVNQEKIGIKKNQKIKKKKYLQIKESNKDENQSKPNFQKSDQTKLIKNAENQKESENTNENNVSKEKGKSNRKTKRKFRSQFYKEKAWEKEDETSIFVGNVPNSVNNMMIKKLFKEFGKIESVRMRSVAVPDINVPKKVAAIKKNFNTNRNNLNFYVKFTSKEDAEKALTMNGTEFKGFHLRVDFATRNQKHDHDKSIYLGNLPFNIEEETVRNHFEEFGEIENVRIIRDSNTGIGKGFGYVNFKSADSVQLALQFGNKNLAGREIRVSRSLQKPKKIIQKGQKTFQKSKQVTRKPMTASSSFQGTTAKYKDSKQKKKIKKKKAKQYHHFS